MTITLDIKPELEAELAAQAAARGLDVPAYAVILLEQAAQPAEHQQRKQTLSEFLMESPRPVPGLIWSAIKDTGRDIDL